MYDLIDNDLRDYYIKGHKYISLVGIFLSLVLSVLSAFYTVAIVFLAMIVIISLVFLTTWSKNKKMYGNKLSLVNDVITICDYKNSKIKEISIECCRIDYIKIAFNQYPKYAYKNCLVIYNNFEPYENMEYTSYWNEPNIVIIQNPQLIGIIDKKYHTLGNGNMSLTDKD